MKRIIVLLLLCVSTLFACAQKAKINNKTCLSYFKEVEKITKKYSSIWDKDLYAPILLVDPETMRIFANEPDTAGVLKKEGEIYIGKLPANIMIANTAIPWNGKEWAMIILPLPKNKYDRINLITHELFHVAQPDLGFEMFNPENGHLDEKEGRIYLRLELEALKKAIQESSKPLQQKHLANALVFRKYRNTLYEHSGEMENKLEINEGLAEYTGMMHAGRSESQTKTHFVKSIDMFFKNPTYTRSFAYQTIPVYGYFLQKTQKDWNKNVKATTDLTDYFIMLLNIELPENLEKEIEKNRPLYNGDIIMREETARADSIKKVKIAYKEKFVKQAHVELVFEQMRVSFDPRNIISLENEGTIYPEIKVVDNWGLLVVENYALMSPSWDKISLALPFEITGNILTGDGWTLELQGNYELAKEEQTGNYKLIKKQTSQ